MTLSILLIQFPDLSIGQDVKSSDFSYMDFQVGRNSPIAFHSTPICLVLQSKTFCDKCVFLLTDRSEGLKFNSTFLTNWQHFVCVCEFVTQFQQKQSNQYHGRLKLDKFTDMLAILTVTTPC